MIYVIGIFISIFLSLLLFTRKGKTNADRILGTWMLCIGFHLFAWYSYLAKIPNYMALVGLNIPLPFLHGPFLYLYTIALCKPARLRTSTFIYHFLLPVAILISVLPFTFTPAAEKLAIIEANSGEYRLFSMVLFLLMGASAVFYILLTNRLLVEHRKRLMRQFSNREKINLNWLRVLFYGMAIMWVLILFVGDDRWIFSAAAVFVIYMGYFGIKQVGIFTNSAESPTEDPVSEKKKYAKSGLDPEASRNLHRNLQQLMETEKPYIQPELTLAEIAAKLQAHPNHVSQVINEMEGKNFYDYINTLRLEAFQRAALLPENQRFTLFSLALDCGFNSKSAFNRFFKKAVGMSPSDYTKGLKAGNK